MPENSQSNKLSTWARQVHIPPANVRAGTPRLRRSALELLARYSLLGDHPGFVDCYPSTVAEQISAGLQISLGTAQRILSSLVAAELLELRTRPVTRAYAVRIDSPHTCRCGSEPLGFAGSRVAGVA